MSSFKFKQSIPKDKQMDEIMMIELKKKLGKEKILSCLILKNNSLIFEYYKNDKVLKNVQIINSCTKSVISALIGTLVDKGLIKSIYSPITDFFSDIIDKQTDERLKKITIYHLLTMSAGFDWPEFGKWNCFAPMVYNNNIIKFIFERPIVIEPGQTMNYNSGCSHLLSAIIQKLTGMSTHDYAENVLFKPIGICESIWHEREGVSLGADGLRITSYDMLKFGNLFLNNGYFNGKQIISRNG